MNKKGFTLVELMVVVAVIAILATALLVGLGGARKRARDARRVSDVRQVQNVLELYYAKTGHYPDANSWAGLESVLTTGDDKVTNQLPQDPMKDDGRTYYYGVSSDQQNYTVGATLENKDNVVLNDDVDGTSNGVDCGSPDDDSVYCVTF